MRWRLIQIVDDQDRPVGAASSAEAQLRGLWHRIVRVMVEDGRGNMLLQKRAPNVETSPNKWDHAAAGHVDAGETYELAARRELLEEAGITAARLVGIGAYQNRRREGVRKLYRFNKVYRAVVKPDTVLKPQASEVTELRWFSVADVKKLITEHPEQVTDGLKHVLKHYY